MIKANLLNILFFCVFLGMILYMIKDVRDAWKLSPKKFGPGVRLIRCVLLAFFYVFPFILTIVAPLGYGLYAFILGVVIAALPIYFIMKPVWAVRPFESLLRKRYGIKQAQRKKKTSDDEEVQAEPAAVLDGRDVISKSEEAAVPAGQEHTAADSSMENVTVKDSPEGKKQEF